MILNFYYKLSFLIICTVIVKIPVNNKIIKNLY